MGIVHPQESAYVKELAKWEHRPVNINGTFVMPIPVAEGGKADFPFQAYPKMLYRASRAAGGPEITGQLIVGSEGEQARAEKAGWVDGQEQAIAAIHAEDTEFARLAANRAYQDKTMSATAKAEALAVDEATIQHQPVIPEKKSRHN